MGDVRAEGAQLRLCLGWVAPVSRALLPLAFIKGTSEVSGCRLRASKTQHSLRGLGELEEA